MKVGYISGISLDKVGNNVYNSFLDELTNISFKERLRYLILCGDITSTNYLIALNFIDDLGDSLRTNGNSTSLRFIAGNRDFYYYKSDMPVGYGKDVMFDYIMKLYKQSPYCLYTNPIIMSDLMILGAETWYDYSLYRGSPVNLKAITKKRKYLLSFDNNDNKYITDKDDYLNGLKETFDYKYTNQCVKSLNDLLYKYHRLQIEPKYKVVVGYFYPSRKMLYKGFLEDYFGTFKGSIRFIPILKSYRVTDYMTGCYSKIKDVMDMGVNIHNVNIGDTGISGIRIVDYSV